MQVQIQCRPFLRRCSLTEFHGILLLRHPMQVCRFCAEPHTHTHMHTWQTASHALRLYAFVVRMSDFGGSLVALASFGKVVQWERVKVLCPMLQVLQTGEVPSLTFLADLIGEMCPTSESEGTWSEFIRGIRRTTI